MFNVSLDNKEINVGFHHNFLTKENENGDEEFVHAQTFCIITDRNSREILDWDCCIVECGDNLSKDRRRKNCLSEILLRNFPKETRKEIWMNYFSAKNKARLNGKREDGQLFSLWELITGVFKH